MSLLTKPTATDAADTTTAALDQPSAAAPARRPWRQMLAWLGIAALLLGLAILVSQMVDGDADVAPTEQQVIRDPKDRPGYRSPTINRPLTTGDPKDWPGYGPVAGDPPTGDPKDRPGYRSPTINRPLTTGDPKDWPGYRSVTDTDQAPTSGSG